MIVTPRDPNTIPFEAGMIGEIRLKKLYQRKATAPFSENFVHLRASFAVTS